MLHYLNNAGAGLMSENTFNTITEHLQLEGEVGAYKAAQIAKEQTEQFYSRVATLLNAASPKQIAFMDSASRGWNMVINGANIHKGDLIVTLSSEFGTNLITIYNLAQKIGAKVQIIKCNMEGDFSLDDLKKSLEKGARMVALSHAAAQGSIVYPVEEIGNLTKQYDALYIVDGCQAAGQMKCDVKSMKCDAYVGTGRKWLCGPRGTGFLYVKEPSSIRTTQLDLSTADLELDNDLNVLGIKVRTDAKRFELWERSIAGMLGLSSAINEYISNDQTSISNRIRILSNRLRKAVANNLNLNLVGKLNSESGIVGFFLQNPKQENNVKDKFEKANIGFSTMSDWDCPLHFPRNGASVIFRLSPHYNTTDSTIDAACNVISGL